MTSEERVAAVLTAAFDVVVAWSAPGGQESFNDKLQDLEDAVADAADEVHAAKAAQVLGGGK